MKILVITGTTDPRSGLGRYSKEIVRELRSQGEDAIVLAKSGERDAPLFNHSLPGLIHNAVAARKLARSADLVHALDAWPFAIYGFFAVLGTRKPLYINGVGTYSIPPARLSVKRLLMLAAYRRARHVFSISAYTQERIRERLPFARPMSVVHLGATPLPPPDTSATAALRERYRIETDAEIVLTVGEIKDRKGQLDTLRAILDARRARPKLVYIMIGNDRDTEYVAAIKGEAAARRQENAYRIVTDASSDDALAAWYSMASVFVLASNNDGDHFEGFGLVFLEAAQFGVPGIGTKGCGIEDAVRDGATGLLVPQRDPSALVRAILAVLSERQAYSAAAQESVKNFSWRSTVEQYRIVYYS